MELRHLRYFVAVAEEENVTRAAARLRIAQPSLSRQILYLEDELQLSLFNHHAKSIRLTDAGRIFLAEARAVLARLDEAVRTAQAINGTRETELHIGYAPSLTIDLLPRAPRLLQEEAPEVHVVPHDLSTEEMLAGLHEGELEIALMKRPSDRSLRGLVFEELKRCKVCIALNRTHRLARMRAVGLPTLKGEKLIGFSRRDYPEYHEWLASLFTPLPPPAIAERHDSSTSLIAAVEAGRGVALIAQGFELLAGPRVKVRALEPAPPAISVGVAHRKRKVSAVADKFLAALRHAKVP